MKRTLFVLFCYLNYYIQFNDCARLKTKIINKQKGYIKCKTNFV